MFKKIVALLALIGCVGCAHERRIPTFKEALSENPNLESGIYNRTNGENVQVTIVSLKARIEDLEKKNFDLQHETDYYKRQNDELQHENMTLRVNGNYEMSKEIKRIKAFDAQHNPVIETMKVNELPAARQPAEKYPAIEQHSEAPAPVKPAEPQASVSKPLSLPDTPSMPSLPKAEPAKPVEVAKVEPPKSAEPPKVEQAKAEPKAEPAKPTEQPKAVEHAKAEPAEHGKPEQVIAKQ